MAKEAVIFQAPKFDGNIYTKLTGFKGGVVEKIQTVKYDLFYGTTMHESIVKDAPYYLAATFTNVPDREPEEYYCRILVTYLDDSQEMFESKKITLKRVEFPEVKSAVSHVIDRFFTSRANFRPYTNAEKYYISILFEKNGFDKFEKEKKREAYNKVSSKAVLTKVFSDADIRNNSLGKFSELYTIENDNLTIDEMLDITEELESLPYIKFAVLSPVVKDDTLWEREQNTEEAITVKKNVQPETPDFSPLQDYLEPSSDILKGLNIREAWKHTTGLHATTRHLDLNGIRQDHEDLEENITVVTNSEDWETNNTHSTACNGVIAAKKNSYGVTGIVHGGNHFSYASNNTAGTKLIADILRDAGPGDVISMSMGLIYDADGTRVNIPYIAVKEWWEGVKEIVENKQAIFLLAAGNSSSDITVQIERGYFTDYGDCGVYLAQGCHKETGRHNPWSNHNYHSSHINAWNEWVVTTGRGTLYGEEHARNAYHAGMTGTSISTPLAAGALALIQSYAIEKYNIFLNRDQMLALLEETGGKEAEYPGSKRGKMGYRPDAVAGITFIDSIMQANDIR